ncbi:SMI1/KNR4 family protein [Pseudomonas graminis]|uniref:SMI1 / KNR4 family (SUKH-1) n=1 Tax=Pseudomonas graminis TaxID=158627 RepID=A0A1I0JMV6_9PSED|nr:SMI1/KNR4 family protein [Pseudomonas graminis]SEU11805.1 SMI1 / KNR4 family (SUKH-1) [Pseudomonas graminis]
MSLLKVSKAEPPVGLTDIESLEVIVNIQLPKDFKEFYLRNNGGVPDKDWWDSEDEYDPIRIKKFKAVASKDDPAAQDTNFLGGCYALMTAKDVIPSTLLPFANDDGGNFFCLDLKKGNVCFFATDSFDSECSPATNHANAYRWIAKTFGSFIEGLKDESEIDV